MRNIIYISFFICCVFFVSCGSKENSNRFELGDGLSFAIPENYNEQDHGEYLNFWAVDSTSAIAIKKIEVNKFDIGKSISESTIREIFNLQNYVKVKIDDDTSSWWKDYLTMCEWMHSYQYYESEDKKIRIAIYASYVYEYPYYIALSCRDFRDVEKLKAIVKSADYSNSSWWHKLWVSWNTIGFILAFFTFIIFGCGILKNRVLCTLFGTICGMWATSAGWGLWSVYIPLVSLYSLWGFCLAGISFRDAVDGMKNSPDF